MTDEKLSNELQMGFLGLIVADVFCSSWNSDQKFLSTKTKNEGNNNFFFLEIEKSEIFPSVASLIYSFSRLCVSSNILLYYCYTKKTL
jgi:hypothetical protein